MYILLIVSRMMTSLEFNDAARLGTFIVKYNELVHTREAYSIVWSRLDLKYAGPELILI